MRPPRVFDSRPLLALLWGLLTFGFMAVSLLGYEVSRKATRDSIVADELPLISSNIYSEIQKDLVRPILISSTMAHDTFLREWVVKGERPVAGIAAYLAEVRRRYNAFSSFFVSERTGTYYTGDGVLKAVSPREPRDRWYYRVRAMEADYEINVDPDLANRDALTIFVNYRVHDFSGRYIGVTGIGLTVDSVRRLIAEYQQRYGRKIYFVDAAGRVVLSDGDIGHPSDLSADPGIGALLESIRSQKRGSFQFDKQGRTHLLNVNYLPELKWYLFVELDETAAMSGLQKTLWINLAISLLVTLVVTALIHFVVTRYQKQLETMAATDKLTGLLNRHAFTIIEDKLLAEYRRDRRPIAMLMIDIDHFKAINDRHGHRAGDAALAEVARRIEVRVRASDHVVRWGGEEFLVILRDCPAGEAVGLAEGLRDSVRALPVKVGDALIPVTISVGVASYAGGASSKPAIDLADRALYRAKQAGRDRIEVAAPALS